VSSASAQRRGEKPPKRPPPACGITTLPLQVGNEWVYRYGTNDVKIVVKEIAPGKDAAGKPNTQIKLEETHRERTIPITITCNADGMVIPPDSLLFAGEPGGGVGFTLSNVAIDNVTLPSDTIAVQDYAWIHTVKADAARTAAEGTKVEHPPARIEIERHGLVHPTAPVEIALGSWGTTKMTFELRGRGILKNAKGEEEKAEIPVKRPGTFFYVKNLGVVRIEDSFDKTWDLVSTNVPLPK
jgi:hypothetical protein